MELDKLLRTLLNEKSENSENKGTQHRYIASESGSYNGTIRNNNGHNGTADIFIKGTHLAFHYIRART